MLDQLTNLVKQYAGDAIINNPAIPNERNDEAINETSSSIAGGLQNMLSGGGAQDILKMFSGNQSVSNSSVTNNYIGWSYSKPDEQIWIGPKCRKWYCQ